jgi:hypothetical protein
MMAISPGLSRLVTFIVRRSTHATATIPAARRLPRGTAANPQQGPRHDLRLGLRRLLYLN